MKRVICMLAFFFSFFGNAQNNALFEQGKQQYNNDKFQEAITNWNKIIDAGEHSADLYFNIANAHYKLNHIGPSIYYYEKALQLSPSDDEILNNLAFAQNATIDAIEPLPKTFFAKWDEELSSFLTYEGWAWVTAISALLFTVLFLGYYFAGYATRKRLFFVSSMLCIIVFLLAFSMSFRNYGKHINDRPAIVFAESTEVKSEAKMKSETAFTLHEGTKVQVVAEDGDWKRIELADGKDGWIPASDLKQL
ncbi:MAG: tetratricopeptide repeat protein [Bacteroidetes bacterium]|nr:tetratricopeptide repeat protein [Bacteroidota bacterium]